MDQEELAIETVLCPGPKGIHSIESAQFESTKIHDRQSLLVSSDGLVRGISGAVSRALELSEDRGRSAVQILRDACAFADRFNSETRGHMYCDNLSLLYFRPDGERS
jgi:hypothetical protein